MELRGKKVALRTLERAHCRELWDAYKAVEPLPTEPLNPGLFIEGADRWFDEMQARQGREQVYLGIFTFDRRLVGDIQLANINWRDRVATLVSASAGVQTGSKGYASDAVRIILHYGFASWTWPGSRHALQPITSGRSACLRRVDSAARESSPVDLPRQKRWDEIAFGLLASRMGPRRKRRWPLRSSRSVRGAGPLRHGADRLAVQTALRCHPIDGGLGASRCTRSL